MTEVVDFWLRLGVDGLRLDAVPYLYEREGTSCENLPETHAFLKQLRRHVDRRFPNRMLLAEANQWPEEAVAYFGDGDECHMAFHFPLMPRLFMAIRTGDCFPVYDIQAQTPPIPETCQWAMFLRNHDELTLEMVTEEERLYMYRIYAQAPEARINLGIRRRLAPLMHNDRRRIELMNMLLFSLSGTPVIYYGDELGMGDNIYLGDRDGVRTPMQWSADRNAGFSRAHPQQLYLPLIVDPEYHHATIHVEAQQNNPSSMLWFMKRLIALRKRYRAFGRGSFELLDAEQQSRPRLHSSLRERADPRGGESVALRTDGSLGSRGVSRGGSGGAARPHILPVNRGAAISADGRCACAPLVRARASAPCPASQISPVPASPAAGDRDQKDLGRSRVGRGEERAGTDPAHVSAGPALVRRQGAQDPLGASHRCGHRAVSRQSGLISPSSGWTTRKLTPSSTRSR